MSDEALESPFGRFVSDVSQNTWSPRSELKA